MIFFLLIVMYILYKGSYFYLNYLPIIVKYDLTEYPEEDYLLMNILETNKKDKEIQCNLIKTVEDKCIQCNLLNELDDLVIL